MNTRYHRPHWLALAALLAFAPIAPRVASAADLSGILPEKAQVEKVAGGFKFTEGPAWHPQGFLLFTDIPNERLVKLEPDGKLSDFYTPSGRCNGLMCDQAGFVYACQMGEGHVLKLNAQGDLLGLLVEKYDGNILNGPNDLALMRTVDCISPILTTGQTNRSHNR
ncbi:MAG: SMP-30/gluconolactonase/LRE family protein [Planctomycetaceae bacterium]